MTLKTFLIVKSEFDILMWFIIRVSDKDSPDRPTKPMDVLTIAKKRGSDHSCDRQAVWRPCQI